MTEEFLHYIWKYRLFSNDLTTITGEKISVIRAGLHNTDAGPDFFDARIKIGTTLWAGNVEIHVNSSSWEKHNHQRDSAYNNVILHVVYNHDGTAKNADGRTIPTLVLHDKFDKQLYERYTYFRNSKAWIACEKQVSSVDEFIKRSWLERLGTERLERKSKIILDDLKAYNYDWAEVFHIHLAKNFGLKINSEPFTLLARSLPLSVLGKHKDSLHQVEALLYGQAGFLEGNFKDEYPLSLKKEFDFLRKKYSLKPLESHLWKFLRLRPSGFPTLRISQYANLFFRTGSLFSTITESENAGEICQRFRVSASEYWNSHYTFETPLPASSLKRGKKSSDQPKKLGESTINAIFINTIVPFLFIYGRQKANSKYQERALKFLESLSPEQNAVTRQWESYGLKNSSAFDSQSLLELKNEYCQKKKCLDCAIGNHLLR